MLISFTFPYANAESVPDWVKNNAGWWATDAISEKDKIGCEMWVEYAFSTIYLNKGISLVELEKYEDAVTCYDKAATIDANDSLIWYNRGVALTQLEKYDDAISSYEKAIEVSPGYADAWYNKAELLKHKGQDAEAETCFAKVTELEGE